MREERFFYTPLVDGALPPDEARHAVRVLRLREGDEIWLADGRGRFHRAEVTLSDARHCLYRVVETREMGREWRGRIHLAMAPTKLSERTEWLVEKATEIGVDELTFLDCRQSERHGVRADRVERIVTSALKQSRKAWRPLVGPVRPFAEFAAEEREGDKFICHCRHEADTLPAGGAPHLMDALRPGAPATVMIGPEGDFSHEEVLLALSRGWRAVTLGSSRLRTETAALVAVDMMRITNRKDERQDT